MADLPLHCKPVGRSVDFGAVSRLDVNSQELLDEWRHSSRWCTDASRYSHVVCGTPQVTKLSKRDIAAMIAAKTVSRMPPGETPRSYANVFCVAEWAKEPPRRRRVCHPVAVNDACGRDTLRDLRLPSRREIRAVAFEGEWVCCLDAASFFDQFGLSDDVANYFCFRDRAGKTYRQTAMAMGQRQSTEVATALMRILCAFDHDGVRIDIATDNLRFVGQRADVIAAVARFCERCDATGVVLNELTRTPSRAQIEALVVQDADFLGEFIDYRDKTVRVRAKIVERIAESWSLRDSWTCRQHLGLVATLLWVSAPLAIDIAAKFNAMAFLRHQGRVLHFHPELWDAPVCVPPAALAEIAEWVATALANKPTTIPRDQRPEMTILTDASEWGWAAAAVSGEDTKFVQYPWGCSLDNAARSTTTEPEAIWRALCRFVSPARAMAVRVATDHAPFVQAIAKGFSASAGYNGILQRIRSRFPLLSLTAVHIPGSDNAVDQLSRGAPADTSTLDHAQRGVMGLIGNLT